jgi:hypothetical protein
VLNRPWNEVDASDGLFGHALYAQEMRPGARAV